MIKAVIFPLALIVVVVIFSMLVVPEYNEAKMIRDDQIKTAEKELANQKKISQSIATLDANFNQGEVDEEGVFELERKLQYSIPNDSDVKSLLVQLEALFEEGGIFYDGLILSEETSEELRPGQTASTFPLIKRVQVSVEIYAPYERVMEFIENIENLERVSNIKDLSLSFQRKVEGDSAGSNLMMAEFNMEFYMKEKIEAQMAQSVFRSAVTASASTSSTSTSASSEE